MTRFIMPVILIAIAISLFFMFTNPIYNDISGLKAKADVYNKALDSSKALENQRDLLTAKKNAINPDNLLKLEKLLPQNVDNIRLILEIGQIAAPYGMVLKNVKYSTASSAPTIVAGVTVPVATVATATKEYGTFDLGFSITGSYNNFINFTKDLESNLRIVDISSITFSSDTAAGANLKTISPEIYTYDFKIRTYWLKN